MEIIPAIQHKIYEMPTKRRTPSVNDVQPMQVL